MTRTAAASRTAALPRLPVGDSYHSSVAGVWALKNCTSVAQVQASDVSTALAVPGVKGFSLRVPWSSVWDSVNHVPSDSLGLLQAAKNMLNAGQGLMIRFVAGAQTPSDIKSGVDTYTADGLDPCASNGEVLPVPFHLADGSVNLEFEGYYTTMAIWLLGQVQALGAVMGRLPWYGDDFAELNNGLDVRGVANYTYARWLTGHERLFNIAFNRFGGKNIPYEHPTSGCGFLTGASFPASTDLPTYIAGKQGASVLGPAYVQGNGVTLQSWGVGFFGTATQATEQQFTGGTFTGRLDLRHGSQMINPGDWASWPQIFAALVSMRCEYLEVYTGTGSGDGANPGQTSFSGPNAATLKAEILNFNKYTAARAAAAARTAA